MDGAARSSKGVMHIEQKVAANNRLPTWSGSRLLCCICAIKAKQNSPPWARARPLRQAVSMSAPRNLTRAATAQPFNTSRARVRPRISRP
ncbi:hypothetical protein D3C81_1942290 [compost metagenome]